MNCNFSHIKIGIFTLCVPYGDIYCGAQSFMVGDSTPKYKGPGLSTVWKGEKALGRFQYYTIYRCASCGKLVRVHGKLTSQLVLPPGFPLCCSHPKLKRERYVRIEEYDKGEGRKAEEEKHPRQKSLFDFGRG